MGGCKIILCVDGEHEGGYWRFEDKVGWCCKFTWCLEGVGRPQDVAWSGRLDLLSSRRFHLAFHFIKLLLRTIR